MGTILAVTTGLCVWLVMWALDIKAMDAFIVTILIVVVALAVRMILPSVPGNSRE